MVIVHLELIRQKGSSLFDRLDDPNVVRSMRIWYSRVKDLHRLVEFTQLEELEIAGYTSGSFDLISGLSELRFLRVVHMPGVGSIEALAGLKRLKSLSLATLPTWDVSGKISLIKSLVPIGLIPELKHLELFGVCPPSRSLEDLYHCTWLTSARFSKYESRTVDEFYRLTGAQNEFNPPPMFAAD